MDEAALKRAMGLIAWATLHYQLANERWPRYIQSNDDYATFDSQQLSGTQFSARDGKTGETITANMNSSSFYATYGRVNIYVKMGSNPVEFTIQDLDKTYQVQVEEQAVTIRDMSSGTPVRYNLTF